VLVNSPPELSIALKPEEAYSDTILNCTITFFSDKDDTTGCVPCIDTTTPCYPPHALSFYIPAFFFSRSTRLSRLTSFPFTGRPFTFQYNWYLNSALLADEVGEDLLPKGRFRKGDEIYCTIIADDSTDTSTPFQSKTVIIGTATLFLPLSLMCLLLLFVLLLIVASS
jgi:hypothetical protein